MDFATKNKILEVKCNNADYWLLFFLKCKLGSNPGKDDKMMFFIQCDSPALWHGYCFTLFITIINIVTNSMQNLFIQKNRYDWQK